MDSLGSSLAFARGQWRPIGKHYARLAYSGRATSRSRQPPSRRRSGASPDHGWGVIPVLVEADTRGGFPNRLNFDSPERTEGGSPMAAAIGLGDDYDAGALRAAAKRSKDGPQARRLLGLAAIYDGATRTEATKIGGVGLQVVRDWVMKFN